MHKSGLINLTHHLTTALVATSNPVTFPYLRNDSREGWGVTETHGTALVLLLSFLVHLAGVTKLLVLGGSNLMQMYGKIEGIPENHSALFGLVI